MKNKKPIKKVKKTTKKIHKKMTFMELMKEDKDAAMHLAEKGMFCCGCPMALTETIEQGAQAHGIIPEELVNELNSKKKKHTKVSALSLQKKGTRRSRKK